jgi:small-conductance mechanosensitive channel
MTSWMETFRGWMEEERMLALPLALALAVALTLLTKVFLRSLAARFRRAANKSGALSDEALSRIFSGTKALVLLIWYFFFLARTSSENARIHAWISGLVIFATVLQTGIWGMGLIRTWNERVLLRRAGQDPSSAAALGLLNKGVQAAFLSTLVLMGLGNLGVNIGALIAGLGVGGIAVALAAQNILGDLLASLSIVLDKPFSVGDFIAAGNEKGTVESIGIKTTRIRGVTGEQIILSNKDLLESRVRNFKRLVQRRIEHRFAVDAGTPATKLEGIPARVAEVFQGETLARLERCQLSRLGDSGPEFEMAFWVLDSDQQLALDIQHRVWIGVLKKLEQERVLLAAAIRPAFPAPGPGSKN